MTAMTKANFHQRTPAPAMTVAPMAAVMTAVPRLGPQDQRHRKKDQDYRGSGRKYCRRAHNWRDETRRQGPSPGTVFINSLG